VQTVARKLRASFAENHCSYGYAPLQLSEG
jgi:hypothetical protein